MIVERMAFLFFIFFRVRQRVYLILKWDFIDWFNFVDLVKKLS